MHFLIELLYVTLVACTGMSTALPRLTHANEIRSSKGMILKPMVMASYLMCKATENTMSCYGGTQVNMATCYAMCTCDMSNKVSCRSFSYCDDNAMDNFCASSCLCSTRFRTQFDSSYATDDEDDDDEDDDDD